MTVRLASCSCGQLRAEVLGEPISVFSAQASFPRESVAIRGNGTQFVRVGDEGGRFTFTFCPKCGSTVFYVEECDEQHIVIPVGAFAEARFAPPTVSVYEERKHSWVTLPADVEVHRRNP
jgi:hypothetical protein